MANTYAQTRLDYARQAASIAKAERLVLDYIPNELRKYIRFEPNPATKQIRLVTSVPMVFDTGHRKYRLADAGENSQITLVSPKAFETYYKTPTEAVRFEGTEPYRTGVGNAFTSVFTPVSQRQFPSIDAYGSDSRSPTGGILEKVKDIALDAERAIGKAIPTALTFMKKPSRMGVLKKAALSGAAGAGTEGLHSAAASLRGEDYNGSEAGQAAIQGLTNAASGGLGGFVTRSQPEYQDPPKNSLKDIEAEAKRSLNLPNDYVMTAADVKAIQAALESADEGSVMTKSGWVQKPYRDFTAKHPDEKVNFKQMPIPRSGRLGRALKADRSEGSYTLEDWNKNLGDVLDKEQLKSIYASDALKTAVPTLNNAYFDRNSQTGRLWFGVPKSRQAGAESGIPQRQLLLYPDDPKLRDNSYVVRQHRYSKFSDDPSERVVGLIDDALAYMDDPELDKEYKAAKQKAAERRKASPSAANSKAPVISVRKYQQMSKPGATHPKVEGTGAWRNIAVGLGQLGLQAVPHLFNWSDYNREK